MRAKEFLLEYNQQLTIQNFGDRVINQFKKEGERAWGMMLMNLDRANKEPEMYEYYKTSLIQDLEKLIQHRIKNMSNGWQECIATVKLNLRMCYPVALMP